MSVHEHIRNGNYSNQMTFPTLRDFPDSEALKEARKAYATETRRLEAQFKTDLLAEYGVTDHPKADRCYSLAWEHGHAAGLAEVAGYFDEFVELIK